MCSVTLLGTLRNFPFNTQVYIEATVVDWSIVSRGPLY